MSEGFVFFAPREPESCAHEWAFDVCMGNLDTEICLLCHEVRSVVCATIDHGEDPG